MSILIIPKIGPEISDKIVSFDANSLARQPVSKSKVIQGFLDINNSDAAKIVESIPDNEGWLDPDAVDRLLINVHCELQRVSEEFQHGQ